MLFKNLILERSGRYEEALAQLEIDRPFVTDILAWRAKRAELILRTGGYETAQQLFEELITEFTENYKYHTGLQAAALKLNSETVARLLELKGCDLPSTELELNEGEVEILAKLYSDLGARFPKSWSFQKIPLGFLVGEAFKERVGWYLKLQLRRCLPSLGSDLSSIYVGRCPETGKMVRLSDPHDLISNPKFLVVSSLAEEYVKSLKTTGAFPGSTEKEPPTTLLWALYLHTQMKEKANRVGEALEIVEECIAHTPTALDMLNLKARLLKKSGDLQQAADVMDASRKLDLADRYVNNKTTKYLLRADRVEEAQSVIALFARHEGDPQYNLFEMQCMWYELEWAESQLRQKRYGHALKKFAAVEKHFSDFVEDQFDFHSYCIRKMTLRAYVDILRYSTFMRTNHT